ncbi:NADH dehydrogenase [ubiquinone] 1 beta subcomplex subunit 3 [Halotydeus destructor]|nr:NADH dehydrogenase [ubiquinone] 1 beta subcomplex subunit 3 [Halotydeus destructor]
MGNKTPGGMEPHWPSYFIPGKEKPAFQEPPEIKEGFKDTKGKHMPAGTRIRDWRSYKIDQNVPELVDLEQRLAARGLKDPWARNEVWRFDRRLWGTPADRWFAILKPFKYGFIAFVLTVAYFEAQGVKRGAIHHPDPSKYPLINEKFDGHHAAHH